MPDVSMCSDVAHIVAGFGGRVGVDTPPCDFIIGGDQPVRITWHDRLGADVVTVMPHAPFRMHTHATAADVVAASFYTLRAAHGYAMRGVRINKPGASVTRSTVSVAGTVTVLVVCHG